MTVTSGCVACSNELLYAKCDYCTWVAEKLSLLECGDPKQHVYNQEEEEEESSEEEEGEEEEAPEEEGEKRRSNHSRSHTIV